MQLLIILKMGKRIGDSSYFSWSLRKHRYKHAQDGEKIKKKTIGYF